MELQNYFANNWCSEKEVFTDYLIQMFVERNGRFNYTFFNEVNETKFTHAEINKALEAVSGSKLIPFTDCIESDIGKIAMVLKLFKKEYEFGRYKNARYWIKDIDDQTDVVVPRELVLNWIAKQRPDRSISSFCPINDGNLYHASEKECFSKPAKRADAQTAEL